MSQYGVEVLPPKTSSRGGDDMTDCETFSLITSIIGLVISAISLGIHIGSKEKNNRH